MTPREGSDGQGRPSTEGGMAWRRPGIETASLGRYIATLRERLGLIVLTLFVTTAVALAYLAVAEKTYEAEADLLVTPVSSEEALTGLPLIRESSDPTRDVETVARLVTTRDVAQRVQRALRGERSIDYLLGAVEAAPVAQSNIVAITATASEPERAKDIANGFGRALVANRTRQLHEQVDKAIARLRQRIAELPPEAVSGPGSLRDQLSRLETLRAGTDPTIRLETQAAAPTSPASPKPFLTILAGLVSGLILGVGGAFALHALDPRLRRESQLRELYKLPILARIPREMSAETSVKGRRRLLIGPRRRRRKALAPGQLSPATLEAFRTLRTMLAGSRMDRREHKSLLVTGPSPSEGKTTTAINLAASFALAGNRVILIEADFRRPTVGEALGVRSRVGIGRVLMGTVALEDALVPAAPFGDNLRLLLVDRADEWLPDLLSLPAAGALLDEAEQLADYVLIDSPPLTEVIDALPIAQQVDDVIVVVRLGSSNVPQLSRLSDLLAQNGITPSGFVLVGVGSSSRESYYLSAQRERMAHPPEFDELEVEPEADRGSRRAGSVRP